MAEMLKVSDLHVYYGSIHAVKGVSFEVHEGEVRYPDRGERRRKIHRFEYRFGAFAPPFRLGRFPRQRSARGSRP